MRELFAETPTPTNKFTHQHHTSVSAPSGDCEVGDRCHVSGYVILHQEFSALRPINNHHSWNSTRLFNYTSNYNTRHLLCIKLPLKHEQFWCTIYDQYCTWIGQNPQFFNACTIKTYINSDSQSSARMASLVCGRLGASQLNTWYGVLTRSYGCFWALKHAAYLNFKHTSTNEQKI